MAEYPMTPEQEQEMRAVAQRMLQRHPRVVSIVAVASRLGGFVFKDGRLSDTVSFQRRCQIAQEEIDAPNRQA